MDDNHKRDSFVRQRRNLMLASSGVLFLYVGGFRLSQINVLGNTFEVENPERLMWAVNALFIYFLMRYYQYFNAIRKSGDEHSPVHEFLELFMRFSWLTHYRAICEHFRKECDYEKVTSVRRSFNIDDFDPVRGERKPFAILTFHVDASGYRKGQDQEHRIRGGRGYQIEIPQNGLARFVLWHIASIVIALRQHQFSEYYLPIVFALFAAACAFLMAI